MRDWRVRCRRSGGIRWRRDGGDLLLALRVNPLPSSQLGHIPQGNSDAYHAFATYMEQVIQRYWRTIVGQFTGHTHRDEFEIYYSDPSQKSDQTAISVTYIAPSLTPYTK